jgi:hypothetical protein
MQATPALVGTHGDDQIMTTPVLFAAGLDWLEALIPVLFVLFWIVSQVVNVVRAIGRAAQPKPVPPPPVRPAADPAMAEARRDLERHLEEFLKRNAGGEPPPPPRSRKERRPAADGRGQRGGNSRSQRQPQPDLPLPVAATVPAVTRSLGSLASQTTDVARHVEEAFAHDLQHRTGPAPLPAAAAEKAAGVGGGFAAAIRDRESLRRLILLQEVLERPVERW